MKKHAIIVAGGIGTRMKSDVPKQFLPVDGEPIIVRSIRKFLTYDKNLSIVIVLPEDHIKQWEAMKFQYFPDLKFKLATGGLTRTASVMSGLALIEDGLVAIHDAVRPFVSVETISESFKSADGKGSGVAAVELKDSIRELDGNLSTARDRSNYVLVQTPQTFRVNELKEAYQKVGVDLFTDDASVFEAAGYTVQLVDGSYDNIKITTPEDLK
ncbi:2-C-methyl-D-erythritol 4-phosphate cytidylyltransferase [Ekhidna sp. To15]|uniref:2-C-methyl-D-erythritol 4-phosphate cytidylyltransferase n=1 Tax=Ekhidna sp. To15 TaxID=3395267 RepID=UPI003F5259CA